MGIRLQGSSTREYSRQELRSTQTQGIFIRATALLDIFCNEQANQASLRSPFRQQAHQRYECSFSLG